MPISLHNFLPILRSSKLGKFLVNYRRTKRTENELDNSCAFLLSDCTRIRFVGKLEKFAQSSSNNMSNLKTALKVFTGCAIISDRSFVSEVSISYVINLRINLFTKFREIF